jgi:hypothetical protein
VGTTLQLTLVAVVAATVGVVAGWRTLEAGTLRSGAAAAVGAALVGLVAGVPAVVVAVNPILAAAHLLYLAIVITLPVLAVAGVIVPRVRRAERPSSVLTVVLVLVATVVPAVGFYATHVEPYRLRVDRATIVTPLVEEPVRIGVLADVQTRSITGHERRAVELLLAERPDVILIPGDLHQGTEAEYEAALDEYRALLSELTAAPAGAFAVSGDSEHQGELIDLTEGTGVTVLDDRVTTIDVRGQRLVIAGTAELLGGDGFRILLSHLPDVALDLEAGEVDLVVSGHTHGGQVAIPGFGPLITRTAVPRDVAAGGLGDVDGTPVYVSTGVGMARTTAPQVRLFVRPSVGVIDLVPE